MGQFINIPFGAIDFVRGLAWSFEWLSTRKNHFGSITHLWIGFGVHKLSVDAEKNDGDQTSYHTEQHYCVAHRMRLLNHSVNRNEKLPVRLWGSLRNLRLLNNFLLRRFEIFRKLSSFSPQTSAECFFGDSSNASAVRFIRNLCNQLSLNSMCGLDCS